jgi:hypothetical protein
MAIELGINRHSKHLIDRHVDEMLNTCPVVVVTLEDPAERDSGRWTMSRLWRSWMTSTAEYMADNGATMPLWFKNGIASKQSRPFNSEDAHEAFTRLHMGTDNHGNRYSWKRTKKPGEPYADKGMRVDAMQKHQAFMLERGIKFLDPQESEFRSLVNTLGLN